MMQTIRIHDLTEYHIIKNIRSSIADKTLHQELLQKADSLKSLKDIAAFCENFESAKYDRNKLNKATVISRIEQPEGMTSEDIVAAISNYKKKKQHAPEQKTLTKRKCNNRGYDWPHVQRCPAQGKVCNNCEKVRHFEQVCRSSKQKHQKAFQQ